MSLSFTISQEEYCHAVELMLRQRRKTPANILIFLFMTVVQFGFALWNFFSSSQPDSVKTVLLIISACIFIVQIIYQFSLRGRAKAQMELDIRKGKISSDFWSRQYLALRDDVFIVKCGKSELKYDCAYYSSVKELDNMLLICFTRGKTVHQLMVPVSAFSSAEQVDEFLAAMEQSKRNSITTGLKLENHKRPEEPEYSVAFSYDLASFCKDQVKAARGAYLDRIGWTLSTVARLAASIFLIYHIIIGSYESTSFSVFVVCIIIVLLYPLILAFTPLCSLLVKNNARVLFCGMDSISCTIDAFDGTLYYKSEVFYNEIPLENVYSVVCAKLFTAFYLKDNSVLTIPYATAKNADTARLAYYVDAIADINWKNRSFKEKMR